MKMWLVAVLALLGGACATSPPTRASCPALASAQYNRVGASPCGYDKGSQAQTPSGP